MSAAWITRDKDGVVSAAYVAQHCDPSILRDWRRDGRTPELVDCGPGNGIRVGAPLPDTARVIDTN